MNESIELDVRELPPRERHPKIFKTWEELPVGAAMTLVNDHDPKPLFYEFQAERAGEFRWTPLERGPERWTVEIRRVAPAAAAPAREASASERPSWALADRCPTVDVREDLRAGAEPFQKIMAAAVALAPGDAFVVRAIFEPRPLYAILAAQGFEAWPERLADDDWKVYFRRKGAGGHRCGCGGHGHE